MESELKTHRSLHTTRGMWICFRLISSSLYVGPFRNQIFSYYLWEVKCTHTVYTHTCRPAVPLLSRLHQSSSVAHNAFASKPPANSCQLTHSLSVNTHTSLTITVLGDLSLSLSLSLSLPNNRTVRHTYTHLVHGGGGGGSGCVRKTANNS